MTALDLPAADGGWRTRPLGPPGDWVDHPGGFATREAFAAAHVAADPFGDNVPGAPAAVDWDATLAFRRELFRYGFGVAEAMDTAQRNMGLDWPATQELDPPQCRAGPRVRRPDRLRRRHRPPRRAPRPSTRSIDAYAEQVAFVESTGSQVILMASRAARRGSPRHAEDYLKVYGRILDQVREPVILHWLGEVFDPQLRGYWGSDDLSGRHRHVPRAGPRARARRSTASRCRCSPPSTRPSCGPRCRRGSGSTPATTSTTPS